MNLNIKTKYSPEPEELLAPEHKNITFKKGIRIMKKNMKKVMALALAASMTLGMTTVGLAAINEADAIGSITIENATANKAYNAYKIFDVRYNGDKSTYTYIINAESDWFGTVMAYADTEETPDDEKTGLTLTLAVDGSEEGKENYVVKVDDTFSATHFSGVLYAVDTTGFAVSELENDGGKATAESLDLGYYFVTSEVGSLCNLTTTDPSASIYDKNDVPFEKVDGTDTVELGETVNYKLTGKVPDTTGFDLDDYTYTITDTMSEGLTFHDDVVVYVGDKDEDSETFTALTKDTDYTVDYTKDNGFDLEIFVESDSMQSNYKNKEIKIEYTATVNDKAIASIQENTAILTYTNNPNGSTKTVEKEEKLHSAKIEIDKYYTTNEDTNGDGQNDTKPLAGAKFVLYKEVKTGTDPETGEDILTKQYYKYADNDVSWVTDINSATVAESNETGDANFVGLCDGDYFILETEAPAGYNLLDASVPVTIAGSNTDASANVLTQGVENMTGSVLPETGGMGTTIFYILGSIMALGAGVILFAKKRMGIEE